MTESYIIQGLATSQFEQAALVIFNNDVAPSTRLLTVRGVEVRPSSPNPSATIAGSNNFRRITACASGSGDDVAAFPHSAGAALPAQVLIKTNCLVTASSHNPYRRLLSNTTLGISTGNSYLGNGSCCTPFGLDTAVEWCGGDGTMDVVTLAEGEGIACIESTMEAAFTFGVQIVFTIGSSTYSAMMYGNASNGGEASWALFNGAGSGVTIKINSIRIADQGTANITQLGQDTPYIRYSRIRGYTGGEALPIVPLNSGNTAPVQLIALKNRLQAPLTVSAYESGSLAFTDFAYPNGTAAQTALVRRWGTFAHRLPYMGSLGGPNVAIADGNLMFPAPDFGPSMGMDMTGTEHTGVVLRAQEGLAVLTGNVSGFANYYFRARVNHTPPVVGKRTQYHLGIV